MKTDSHSRNRRGIAALEGALVLSCLLVILFFTFDVGLAVVRYNMLGATARAVARQAIIHGADSPPEFNSWGPMTISGTAGGGTEPAAAAVPLLATMQPTEVTMVVSWPDGDNQAGDRVRVILTYRHEPHVPFLGLGDVFLLRAESTMQIVH